MKPPEKIHFFEGSRQRSHCLLQNRGEVITHLVCAQIFAWLP